MNLYYTLLIYLFSSQTCCSYLLLPFDAPHETPQFAPNSKNVGEPLILTPYIKSNQISKARQLSNVKPFLKGIVSNSGYFTVNETYSSNLFFWFFRKSSTDWQKAPLLLWLQGGPGCSSMYGLFEENGPFIVTKKGLKRRKYSWTKDYNVMYMDQPVGTGYSFTNSSSGYISSQTQVADHLYEALTQFFQLYPELRHNEFYVTGESYAGRYIPAIAHKIHILKKAGKSNINLKGLFLISATIDGSGFMRHFADFCYKIGIIDSQTRDNLVTLEHDIDSYIHSRLWSNATQARERMYGELHGNSYIENYYNYVDLFPPGRSTKYNDFLQSSDVRKEIHVGNMTYFYCSRAVKINLYEDIFKTVKPLVEEILEHYPVAFVGGQLDVVVVYNMVVNVLKTLSWSGAFTYSTAKRNMLYDEKNLVGYYKSAGNLKDIFLRRAGHMIPKDQPKVALHVLNKFINKELV